MHPDRHTIKAKLLKACSITVQGLRQWTD